VNFELSTPQFQTEVMLLASGLYDLVFVVALLRARNAERPAWLRFMHCWRARDGWCRLKEFRKYLLCKFVRVHLPHSTAKRHFVEYGSKLHHHESYCSYKHHTVLIVMKI